MIQPSFSIDFDWRERNQGSQIERSTLAEIEIIIGEFSATKLADVELKTVLRGPCVSAYTLALWLAANWWRLRWEPLRKTISWGLAHNVAAAGEGYLWPDITFFSDGDSIHINSRSTPIKEKQGFRYLNDFETLIPASCFIEGIDSFVTDVLGRLSAHGIITSDLKGLWEDVFEERQNPKLSAWRKLEALMGFDPDESPEGLIEDLQQLAEENGIGAIEEIAAQTQEETVGAVNNLWENCYSSSSDIIIPSVQEIRKLAKGKASRIITPWKKAEEVAKKVRDSWGISAGPVKTKTLCEIFQIKESDFNKDWNDKNLFCAGFKKDDKTSVSLDARKPFATSRRFSFMRIIGDFLVAPNDDKLFPSTEMHTQRQRFQRAFAQEVLCPYEDLRNYLDTVDPSDEDIEDSAHYFDVSPRLIETVLVNKGILDRERLVA